MTLVWSTPWIEHFGGFRSAVMNFVYHSVSRVVTSTNAYLGSAALLAVLILYATVLMLRALNFAYTKAKLRALAVNSTLPKFAPRGQLEYTVRVVRQNTPSGVQPVLAFHDPVTGAFVGSTSYSKEMVDAAVELRDSRKESATKGGICTPIDWSRVPKCATGVYTAENQHVGFCLRVKNFLVMPNHVFSDATSQGEARLGRLTSTESPMYNFSVFDLTYENARRPGESWDFVAFELNEAQLSVLGLRKPTMSQMTSGWCTIYGARNSQPHQSYGKIEARCRMTDLLTPFGVYYTTPTYPGFSGGPIMQRGVLVGMHLQSPNINKYEGVWNCGIALEPMLYVLGDPLKQTDLVKYTKESDTEKTERMFQLTPNSIEDERFERFMDLQDDSHYGLYYNDRGQYYVGERDWSHYESGKGTGTRKQESTIGKSPSREIPLMTKSAEELFSVTHAPQDFPLAPKQASTTPAPSTTSVVTPQTQPLSSQEQTASDAAPVLAASGKKSRNRRKKRVKSSESSQTTPTLQTVESHSATPLESSSTETAHTPPPDPGATITEVLGSLNSTLTSLGQLLQNTNLAEHTKRQ